MGGSALVFGAGARQGLGGAVAARFAREGMDVFVVGRTAARLEALCGALADEGSSTEAVAEPIVADCTRPEDVTSAFAAAKAAERAVAQGLAREFGPEGLHVAHVIVDGMIDGDQVRTRMPDVGQRMGEDGMLSPDAIADAYWHLHSQHRSAWTFELDLRPFKETW